MFGQNGAALFDIVSDIELNAPKEHPSLRRIKIYLSIYLIARRACRFGMIKAFELRFSLADLHFNRPNCANCVSSPPVRAAGKNWDLTEPLAGWRPPARSYDKINDSVSSAE